MVKRYEPFHKWYAYDNEPTPEMREDAHGEYIKLETFEHEMTRMQTQIEHMRKEGQQVELTLKAEKVELERRFNELRKHVVAEHVYAAAEDTIETLMYVLEKCRFALEPYDDVKPRDWKTDRERLILTHNLVLETLDKYTE